MIILDTNVVSELMRPEPRRSVLSFVDRVAKGRLFTTAIVRAEIFGGIALMPAGRRRSSIETLAQSVFDQKLGGRVLPFDESAAMHYPLIIAARRALGRPLEGFDGLIAAIARANHATLATRNVRDFDDCGFDVVDP